MKPVPQKLLDRLRKAAPPEADILPLSWAYETEDYNIAVLVPDTMDRTAARQLETRLIDTVMDWDDTHETFTVCMGSGASKTRRWPVRSNVLPRASHSPAATPPALFRHRPQYALECSSEK